MIGNRPAPAEIEGSRQSVLDRAQEKGFDLTSRRKFKPRRLGRRAGLFRIRGMKPATRRALTKPCKERPRHESLYFECPVRSTRPQ
jgi:hypothetical protein